MPSSYRVLLLLMALLVGAAAAQVLPLPARPVDAPTGRQFAQKVAALDLSARDEAVCAEILSGNIPDFLRRLYPVRVTSVLSGQTNTATFYVTPDYLAIGSDQDYLLMPMAPDTAQRLADALHCTLPTRKMVDAIYAAAEVKLFPTPIPPSPAMTTVAVFSNHNAIVRTQRVEHLSTHPLGALVAGHKKDVVISSRLAANPGKVAIYGWQKTNGVPIQPLYLRHTSEWVDYSQCIRLVAQGMEVNGKSNSVARVLSDPALAGLLSDEGTILQPRYAVRAAYGPAQIGGDRGTNSTARAGAPALQFVANRAFHEQVAWLNLEPGIRVQVNVPAPESFSPDKKVLLVLYALPNGNTIEQTVGKAVKTGDDWHFGIQHIGAQTRFLRDLLTDRIIVLAYLENNLKSWPAWRKRNSDQLIPKLLGSIQETLGYGDCEIVLAGHSGGGSLIFGYFNALEKIPDQVVRIAFLDSNYAYERAAGHLDKLVDWLKASDRHCLCVLAYNDAVVELNGKPIVSAGGGTWGKSHEMQRDLAYAFTFSGRTNDLFETYSALDGRIRFLLKENPERKIFHTVQVERNGLIHALLTGTPSENRGYEYFGLPAYTRWIQTE